MKLSNGMTERHFVGSGVILCIKFVGMHARKMFFFLNSWDEMYCWNIFLVTKEFIKMMIYRPRLNERNPSKSKNKKNNKKIQTSIINLSKILEILHIFYNHKIETNEWTMGAITRSYLPPTVSSLLYVAFSTYFGLGGRVSELCLHIEILYTFSKL